MYNKTVNSFPDLGFDQELPIYMRAVGRSEYETPHDYPQGYLRHMILFASEGEGIFQVDDHQFSIKKGDGFLIRKEYPHKYYPVTPMFTTHWVIFDGFSTPTLFKLLGVGNYHLFHNLEMKSLNLALQNMYLLSTEDNVYSRFKTSSLVYDYITEIFFQDKKISSMEEPFIQNKPILYAKRYIEQYYFTDLLLEDIAAYAGVSPQHLCRLFKTHMNMRPSSYINQIRIKLAKRLLYNTDQSITEIAATVGYSTPYYFTNTFKKYEHMTPSDYRSMTKNYEPD